MRKLLLALVIGVIPFAQASAEELRLGFISILSGQLALLGQEQKRGFDLALETLGGKVGGVETKVFVADNKGNPGDLYRLEGDQIPERIRAKNSLHQVDFLETLTVCQALDKVPETVIFGVEPEDIETLSLELTPTTRARVDPIIEWVLGEVRRLGVSYRRRSQ